MSDHDAAPLVPKLRFPEFADLPGWNTIRLGDIAEIIKGKGVSKSDIVEGGTIPCIRYAELYTTYEDVIRRVVSYTDTPGDQLVLSQQGDVIVPASGESKDDIATAACLLQEGVALGGDLNIIRSRLDGSFLSYLLNGPIRPSMAVRAQGNTIAHLYSKQLYEVPLVCPSPPEQRKIADCLGSLDALIEAEGRKLVALEEHRQGLLQQLFPQPGKTVPRLRFPEFKTSGKWRPRVAGSMFSRRKEKGEPGLPLYSVTIASGMVDRSTFDRDFYDIVDATKNSLVREGDIAYNTMRMWQGACGVAAFDCLVSPAYVILSPQPGTHSKFFEHLFKTAWGLQLLEGHSRGLTKDRLRLYYKDFASIRFLVPDHAEQVQIAECITSVDDQLATQARRLDALAKHKRGLLQQLFPVISEY